ncbi:Phosphatidylglycerophosphatase A [Thermoactinomyces sp. DSM 45891]|uniref:phosphatidylglycerophosphatase A family protein n=1 Tax=Thermoactinomyces sp. DSM 45891 TaxID=1761907 RepID=UPI000922F057|nr:phosphatidylglycerophosphatase A [Thermoactinomyces sp. DSM 45891]SFX28249.1 Phosphatidylglycerophosphatase A [Thermoactinomyces sp. DSM 45891]
MGRRVHSSEVYQAVMNKLTERGVPLEAIAEIVYEMQVPYKADLRKEVCLESVMAVLEKRELQHAILVGVELDTLAEKNILSEPLLSIVKADEGLFGCDETLALGSVFGYGSIALTTFGYLDKQKIGIIKSLDNQSGEHCHTFLDDIVCAIAAAAAGRLAHRIRDEDEECDSAIDTY